MSGKTLSSRSPIGIDKDTKSLHFLSSSQNCITDKFTPLSIPENDVMISELSHTKFHHDSHEGNNNCAYCNMYRSSPKRKWHESDQNLIPKELDHDSKRILEEKTSPESVESKPSLNELDASSRPLSEIVVKENESDFIVPFSKTPHSSNHSRVVTALFQDTAPGTVTKTPSNFISPSPLPLLAQGYATGSDTWSMQHPIKRPPPPLPPSSSSILGSPPACSRRRSRAPEASSLGSTFPTIREINGTAGVAPSSHLRSLLSDSHDQDRQERSKTGTESAFDGDQSGVAEPMSSLSVGKRRARTSPPRARRSTIATASGAAAGFGSPKPMRFFATPSLLPDASSAFCSVPTTRLPPPRALSASAAQSVASRVTRSPSPYPSPHPRKLLDHSQDMDELTKKDLGTPVTEVGSPAVMDDIYGNYNDADVDSPHYDFLNQPDLYASAMSPGERDSSGLQASDSDLNSSMDSMEDNARSEACRRKDRSWLPYNRNSNSYGIGIGIGNCNSKTSVNVNSGFAYVFTPAAVAASCVQPPPPAPAAERSLRFEQDDDRGIIRSCRTPLFALNDGFSSGMGSGENCGLAAQRSAIAFKSDAVTSACSNMNSSLAANTTAGSISLSLSLDDPNRHQHDSGCTDSTDDHLEDTHSNLDNSDCSAGSNSHGLASRPAPQQRHSVSSPHPGMALAGVAVVVSKKNSQSAAPLPARPLPDPAAFDRDLLSPVGAAMEEGESAASVFCAAGSPTGPVCPPTPARTPYWGDHHHHHHHHQGRAAMATGRAHSRHRHDSVLHGRRLESDQSSSWIVGDEPDRTARGSSIPPLLPLHRQTSLDETKLLLEGRSGGESASATVNFSKDFEHLGLLGSGVFGDVFLARSRIPGDSDSDSSSSSSSSSSGKLFAVKKSRQQFRSKSGRECLLNEVRAMKKISTGAGARVGESDDPSVYIVQFIRAWQEDSYFYVQIELAERGTLKDLINGLVKAQQTVPDSCLWVVLHDVSAGLAHIHSCDVVHLDIKPANLLISAKGVIKIGDFGMAASVGSKEDKEGDNKYMAGELLDNCVLQPSADIFSLALTLYEASYSEQQLRDGSICLPTRGETWRALREGRAPTLRHRDPAFAALVAAAMSPDPAQRPSAIDILRVPEVAAVPTGLDRETERVVADETLLTARLVQPNPRALFQQGRSLSFVPIHSMGLSVVIPEGAMDDSDRAFTPHCTYQP